MTRLLLGVTLERICKAVLLLCLLHFVIIMILYFDVYAQHLDFFSRFNKRNASRAHPFSNSSRPNGTVPSYGPAGAEAPSPSAKPSPPCCLLCQPGQEWWVTVTLTMSHPAGITLLSLLQSSSPMSMERVQRENPDVRQGGKYTPPDCLPRQNPILRRQKVAYGIYIINQFGEDTFNRAKLLNVGFLEALKDDEEYDCFIFSDVDLIPMDDRNLYRCYEQPRHFAVGMDKFGLPYAGYFGGVSGLSKSQFLKINGFPNEYWGWGGEDDDIFNRISLNGMKVSRPDIRIGRYRMIKHERDKHNEPNPQR
ncbi:Beta-1,4-galactosyltransferase 2 [Pterocles gutturalis]|uniref:Beta-1,4-galactosyltransferase n=1 Tax=Pterocles gutturalis TaxID=240206 RepID=A0A093CGE2_9AVES|nr:Beta-1,4-galactosyltransferase 2 [Pterocles gutturalis]